MNYELRIMNIDSELRIKNTNKKRKTSFRF